MQSSDQAAPGLSLLIKRLSYFSPLRPEEIAYLENLAKNQKSAAAQVDLVREGDDFSSVFILHEGWLAKHRMTPDGERQIVTFVLPGSFVCLDALFQETSDYTVTSLTKVVYSACDVQQILAIPQDQPTLATAIEWAEKREEALMMEHIVSLGQRSAYASVAHLVLELHQRLKQLGLNDDGTYALPLTQELIGDALGLTAVHVNRMLRRLEKEGLIQVDHHSQRRVAIKNAEALADVAGFDGEYLEAKHMPERTRAALNVMKSQWSLKT